MSNVDRILSNLEEGMSKKKCHQCGCMKDALVNGANLFQLKGSTELVDIIQNYQEILKPIKYSCLGCDYCYAAEAENYISNLNEELVNIRPDSFTISTSWPPVAGEYHNFCEGSVCPIAVSTLGSIELVETLTNGPEEGLCIIGKTETENIGIDKIIKNTISNPSIQFLLLAGKETKGHRPGKSLLALSQNGVDKNMKIIGSPGRRPFLKNVSHTEVEQFRQQIELIDMIGCEDELLIREKIRNMSKTRPRTSVDIDNSRNNQISKKTKPSLYPVVLAQEGIRIKLDRKGYFVLIVNTEEKEIIVEYYSNDNMLKGAIKGINSRSIYLSIIENGWISLLSHAAYLGKELERAELSMKYNFKYVQDGA